jgi:hypothetical protein
MKRSFFTLLLAAMAVALYAQIGESRNQLSVGVNGGVNLNNVTFVPKIKQQRMTGLNGGLTVRYISEKYFAMICGVQVELNYAQRGWNELIEDGTNNTYSRTMNYLEIPFFAHLAFGNENRAMGFLNLGPQIAFLLGEQETYSDAATWNPLGRVHEQYGKLAERDFDYGIAGGAGFELRTGVGRFIVEGRYYFGLADFYNNTKKDYFGRSAHSTIQAKITYLFDILK